MSVEYYFSGNSKMAVVNQQFNIGTLEGKTVQLRFICDDMYLTNHTPTFHVYARVDSGETSRAYRFRVNLPFNGKDHIFWAEQLKLNDGWQILSTYTSVRYTVPIVGNALETIVAEITVEHQVPYVVPAVYVTDFETTATFTDLASIDYSAPTVSCGEADPSTDLMNVTVFNIASAHSLGLRHLRVETELEGVSGIQECVYLVKDSTTVTNYVREQFKFIYAYLPGGHPDVIPGKTVTMRFIASAHNGLDGSYTKTFTVPAYVESVSQNKPGSLAVSDTFQLTPVLTTYNNIPPKISGVTYSSNRPDIASVDASGLITAVAEGTCQITITSQDDRDGLTPYVVPSTTFVLVVGDGSFPAFADEYDSLYAALMNDINYALELLAADYSVTLTENIYYNEYYTWLKNMKPCLDVVNSNVKAICTAAGVSHTLPSEWPYVNQNGVWFDIVNEWIDLIQQIHNL